jgi:hypothetical protein
MIALKRLIIWFTILYIVTIGAGGYFYSQGKSAEKYVENNLSSMKAQIESQQAEIKNLQTKISTASANAKFLSLALCPTLEASDKNAPCIKDNTEWFSQTMLAGSIISDSDTKAKMDSLLISLGAKTKPTAKQLYDMLKPIEVSALQSLNSVLQ